MKCYYHETKEGVGTCQGCGKSLCKICIDQYESGLCESCENKKRKREEEEVLNKKNNLKAQAKNNVEVTKKQLKKTIIKSAIFGVIGIFIGSDSGSIGNIILFTYLFAALPWGWAFVKNAIDTGEWAFMAVLTNSIWLFVFGIFLKFTLAFLIGIFVMPISILKAILEFKNAKNLEKDINQL